LVVVAALALPAYTAGAKKKQPPRIGPMPVALFNGEDSRIGFSATVFRAKKVTIRFGDRRRPAEQIIGAGTDDNVVVPFGWEATFSDANRKHCYRIEVVARNGNRTSSRKLDACRLGSPTQGTPESDH
jgi:hypothetical protein